jgi:REP element-mobilizing transposase RayT
MTPSETGAKYGYIVAKTLGYMITWTTYGTWLQGDERGYVKNGRILPGDETLKQANEQLQVQDKVVLSKAQQQVVRQAIIKEAQSQNQRILAMSVNATHVHIVAEYNPQPIDNIVGYYKKTARLALKDTGHEGKTWTKGYDKRFCFDQETLQHRIKYVQNQNPGKTRTSGETGG